MAINNILGITWIKDPITGEFKPLKGLWIKNGSGWQPVTKGYVKVGPDTWEQIYPCPQGTLTASVTSLTFDPVYKTHYYQDSQIGLPVTVTNNGNDYISIIDIISTDTAYYGSTASLGNNTFPISLAPGASFRFNVVVFGLENGSSAGSITVVGNGQLFGEVLLNIPVNVNVLPEYGQIGLSNNSVVFSMFAGDTPPSRVITINNNGNGGTLDITNITANDGSVVSISYDNGLLPLAEGGSLPVTLTAGTKSVGVYNTVVNITSSDGLNPTISVALTVSPKTAIISSNPTQITSSYSNLATEGPEVIVTLINSGNGTLTITSIASESNRTTIVSPPSSISPSSSATFVIKGKQLSSSTTDRLIISNNSSNSIVYYIPINYNITLLKSTMKVSPTAIGASDWTLNNSIPVTTNFITLTNFSEGTTGRSITVSGITFNSGLVNPASSNGDVINIQPALPATVAAGGTLTFKLSLKQNYAGSITDKIIVNSTADNTRLELPITFTNIYVPPATVGPKITVTPATYTINIKQGAPAVSFTVSISNSADSTVSLNVTNIGASSGNGTFSATAFTVAPGTSQNVTATLNYSGLGDGTGTDYINVTSNAVSGTNKCQISLTISPLNPPVISVTPTSITNSAIQVGAAAIAGSIKVNNANTAETNLIVTGISSTSGLITTTQGFPFALMPGLGYTFPITFNYSSLSAAASGYSDNLFINSNDPVKPQLTVPVSTVINPLLGTLTLTDTNNVVSASIAPTIEITTTETRARRIKNTGSAALNVTSITSENGYFTVSPASASSIAVNGTVDITLTFTKTLYSDVGTYTDYLRLVNNGSTPTVRIPVTIKVGHPAGQLTYSTGNDGSNVYTAPYSIQNATYYIVAGGGGGGFSTEGANGGGGGGGGGGGYVTGSISQIIKTRTLSVTVGAGGSGSTATSASTGNDGFPGGTSTLQVKNGTTVTSTYSTTGGGGGKKGYATSSGAGNGAGGACPTDSARNGKPGYTNGQGDKSNAYGGAGGAGVTLPNGGTYGKGGIGGSINDRTSPFYDNGSPGTAGYIMISWPAYTPP